MKAEGFHWTALIAVVGLPTTDGRAIEGTSLILPSKPLPLMSLCDGTSELAGRVEDVESDGLTGRWIVAYGSLFMDTGVGKRLAAKMTEAARAGNPLGVGMDLHQAPGSSLLDIARLTVYTDGVSVPAWPQCRIFPLAMKRDETKLVFR